MKPLRQLYNEAVEIYGKDFVNKETCKLYVELIDSPGKIQRVVDDLNKRTKGRFTASSQAVKKHINARLREGYSVEDLIHVNEVQAVKWMGTPEEKYLRPVTLYNSEKFAGYLADWNRWQERERAQVETQNLALVRQKAIQESTKKADELMTQAMDDYRQKKLRRWSDFGCYEDLWCYCAGMDRNVFNSYDMPNELKMWQARYLAVKVSNNLEAKREVERMFKAEKGE